MKNSLNRRSLISRAPILKTLFTFSLVILATLVTAQFLTPSVWAAEPETITVDYPYYGFVEDPEHPWTSVWDALDETDTIEYSDAFFDESSPGDHPKLRALSYALALAGFENQADGYPSTSPHPNPKLNQLLDQLGFSDYQMWDTSSEADGHSMGTTIGHKTLANGQELVVVAPRNYNYMTEWLSNFNVGTTGDHAGFTESANFIVDRLDQYLSDRNLSNYKIWIVGYSRGGAVVDLAAMRINANLASYDLSPEDLYVYTFGAPRASLTETKYENIHDVKDGNDLLLGYVFPKEWGFYNTGTYEEIHPADLTVTTSAIDISNLADSSTAMNLLDSNNGVVKDFGTMNGKEFMDSWISFVNQNGLTREYFDSTVKPPLSALMQAYQLRTIDKQSEFTGFITDTSHGMPAMVAGNAFIDLMTGGYGSTIEEALANFPPYLALVKVLKGAATEADVDTFLSALTQYIGEYGDYESRLGTAPPVTEAEFTTIKDELPKLIKALAPLLIADAKYTQETYGENYSLFYTYTLVSEAENLVIGHIPESIMPILKSLIPDTHDDPGEGGDDDNGATSEDTDDNIPVPNTGSNTIQGDQPSASDPSIVVILAIAGLVTLVAFIILMKKHIVKKADTTEQ